MLGNLKRQSEVEAFAKIRWRVCEVDTDEFVDVVHQLFSRDPVAIETGDGAAHFLGYSRPSADATADVHERSCRRVSKDQGQKLARGPNRPALAGKKGRIVGGGHRLNHLARLITQAEGFAAPSRSRPANSCGCEIAARLGAVGPRGGADESTARTQHRRRTRSAQGAA